MTCTLTFQYLWSGSVELQRRALFWEVPSLWKWTLSDLWFQLVPIWRTLSVHLCRGENQWWYRFFVVLLFLIEGSTLPTTQHRLNPSSYTSLNLLEVVLVFFPSVMWIFFHLRMPVGEEMAPSPSGWRASPAATKRSPVLALLSLTCRWTSLSSHIHLYKKKTDLVFPVFPFVHFWIYFFLFLCFVILTETPKGIVTLTLSDMKVTRRHHDGWTLGKDLLYTVRSVGLYIIVSVPSKGVTLIWDKHTRLAVELQPHWRVSVVLAHDNIVML